ncbi:RagB/SusD family nutrient uptake outer membrane protein [Fulvivirgaceae bacterium BMA12]|uniref:RagB/SusD family nutrient uptake outer membrane protein n=1 Tax=Agaribacillus aureus TaxID=3051825 RepID=A0ABT8KYH9_9BACT|nr:RagB/SusD family nutrient uptake outer membrane protein [Fulvivirgaceae bacterium BMA12]
MKKMASLLVVFMILNSCNDLDLLPLDRVTTATFYQTRSDFDGAIFAAYSSIQDFWGTSTETLSERGEFWKITMTITDDVAADANAGADQISRDIDNLFIRASDIPFAAIYTQIYEGILRTNLVLENLESENQLTAAEKTAFEGEAKFLRAFFHFQALKMFGTPPLAIEVKKDLNDLALPNATQDALFTQILDDFAVAASNLPESWDGGNTGRATSWAARSFIGKVNVWREDWPAAVAAFEEVVNMGPYALEPTYEDVFAFDNENNAESIFEVQYGGPFSDDNLWVFDDTHSENFKASQGTGRGWYWDASNGAPGGKLGWWPPTQDLVDAYEPGDERFGISIYQNGDMYYTTFTSLPYDPTWSSTGFTIKKYRGERNIDPANHAPNQQADFNNERWFRFAELKLLYAEALLESNNAGDATIQINDIRARAGLPDLAGTATMADLQQEKRIELAFEPHRWFDIVRWGIGPQVFGAAWDNRFEVFPFPQSEIDRSNGLLEQNTGY